MTGQVVGVDSPERPEPNRALARVLVALLAAHAPAGPAAGRSMTSPEIDHYLATRCPGSPSPGHRWPESALCPSALLISEVPSSGCQEAAHRK